MTLFRLNQWKNCQLIASLSEEIGTVTVVPSCSSGHKWNYSDYSMILHEILKILMCGLSILLQYFRTYDVIHLTH